MKLAVRTSLPSSSTWLDSVKWPVPSLIMSRLKLSSRPSITLFIAQFALWFLAREAALAAARQGTDAARQFNAPRQAGPDTAVAFARRHGSGFLLSPAASAAGSGQATVQITVTGEAPSLVPGLTVRVREVARAPVERFTTP